MTDPRDMPRHDNPAQRGRWLRPWGQGYVSDSGHCWIDPEDVAQDTAAIKRGEGVPLEQLKRDLERGYSDSFRDGWNAALCSFITDYKVPPILIRCMLSQMGYDQEIGCHDGCACAEKARAS